MPSREQSNSRRRWFWFFAALAAADVAANAAVLWRNEIGVNAAVILFNMATVSVSVVYAWAIRGSAPAAAIAVDSGVFNDEHATVERRPGSPLNLAAFRGSEGNEFWDKAKKGESGGMLDEFPSELAASQERAS